MTSSLTVLAIAAGLLLVASVLASKASTRFGIPALLLFLVVGMLAGSDGPGGIPFDDPNLAQAMGVVGLVIILFGGGLQTEWRDVRPIVGPSLLLSTVGVGVTAALTGWVASVLLGWRFLDGLLLGAIVSSTDAAAVFGVLRSRSVHLSSQLRSLLEFESGSNDPTAVFLTVAVIGLVTGTGPSLARIPLQFALQMALGAAIGYGAGRLMASIVNRLRLEYDGLYPPLTLGLVLLTYGVSDVVGGNGFLAVYLSGIFMRSAVLVHKRTLVRFHDGLAWLMQIVMFLTLGLLVFPSRLPAIAGAGFAIAGVLMFVSRPLSVLLTLWSRRLSLRERVFVGWVGLRGAAPIVLATFPLVAGVPRAHEVFNIVFFIVLASALIQGTSIPWVAQALGVAASSAPSETDPLDLIASSGSESVEIHVPPQSALAGRRIVDLGLPQGSLVVLIKRGDSAVVPSGTTTVQGGDRIVVLVDAERAGAVQGIFEA